MCLTIIGRSIVYVALQIQNMKLVAFFVSIRFILQTKNTTMKKTNFNGLSLVKQEEVELPAYVQSELNNLIGLALSRNEIFKILTDIGFLFRDENNPGVIYEDGSFSGAYGKVEVIKSFINGKWNFMMRIRRIKKSCLNRTIKIGIKGLNVRQIDKSLPEIQQRLRCQVCKVWKHGKRYGWYVYLDIPYQEKGDIND